MDVIVMVVGIGGWSEYTKPCIESIFEHEPKALPLIIDNGVRYAKDLIQLSSRKYRYANIKMGGSDGYNPVSYAKAINHGLITAKGFDFKWLIVINNDVLCTGPFISVLNIMDEDSLYGNRLHLTHRKFDFGSPWVDGWFYAIPKKVLDTVGKWDDNFKTAAFEDADYSYRAFKAGFTVRQSDLPFIHLEKSLRKLDENFKGDRLFNLKYLIKKHNFKKK